MAGLSRASVIAFKKESVSGEYEGPTAGTDFPPLRPGDEISYEPEQLTSDELVNDIGATKSATGKEVTNGKFPAYLRHSGVEGQAPQLSPLWESIFGSVYVASTEYDTIAGSSVLKAKVNTGEGVNFRVGQALLLKIGSGYQIRNISSISGDDLFFNFQVPAAPGVGVNLGKAIHYAPVAQGHPSVSVTKYQANGLAIEAVAGAAVKELSIKADANGYGEVDFSYEGVKYFFNPIIIDATNKYLDVTDDGGTFAVSVTEKVYKTPVELAEALQAALEAASAETYTVTFSSVTGKFTIASGSSVLSLLWNTGANAANTIGTALGFDVSANDTSAVSYTSDDEQDYSAPYTPTADSGDKIIIKNAELFIGSTTDNVCICAQSVAIKVSKTVEDEDCICEESGIASKIATAREATMDVTATLKKHDVALLNALLSNSDVSAMLNCGPKSGGNWVPGKCFNFYMQTATVSKYTTSGENFVQANISLKGFVSSTTKDAFANFI